MNITMPKSCVSCQSFTYVGVAEDEHCPFPAVDDWSPKPTRTKFGNCSTCRANVFITEICPSYEADPYIDVVEVINRPAPMEPRQNQLF